jgi:hypothetical protein
MQALHVAVWWLSYLYRPLFLRINQAVSQSASHYTPSSASDHHPSPAPAPAPSFQASTESLSTFLTLPTPYYVLVGFPSGPTSELPLTLAYLPSHPLLLI